VRGKRNQKSEPNPASFVRFWLSDALEHVCTREMTGLRMPPNLSADVPYVALLPFFEKFR
jgi:hypothetical protein